MEQLSALAREVRPAHMTFPLCLQQDFQRRKMGVSIKFFYPCVPGESGDYEEYLLIKAFQAVSLSLREVEAHGAIGGARYHCPCDLKPVTACPVQYMFY